MEELILIAVCLVVGQLAALGLLVLVGGWLKPSWTRQVVPPDPAEPRLPESGIVIHHKKLCACQHGCKSGECDK